MLQVGAASCPLASPWVRGCAASQNHRPSPLSPDVHSGPLPICSCTAPRDPNLDPSFPCQLPSVGATEPAATFPRDTSEAIYQMHRLHSICKIHICPLVGSFHQSNTEDGKSLMVQTLEDELASDTCFTSKQMREVARATGHWKRTRLCSPWVRKGCSELMSRSSDPDRTGQWTIMLATWTLAPVGYLSHARGHAKQGPRPA